MKWLRFLLLLGVVFAVGCSSAPSGSGGEVAPAEADDVDEALEAEAAGMGAEESSSTEE